MPILARTHFHLAVSFFAQKSSTFIFDLSRYSRRGGEYCADFVFDGQYQ